MSSELLTRLPPHSIESEMAALGCQLLDPSACIPIVQSQFQDETVHYDLRHQTIQRAIFDMASTGIPVDLVSLTTVLRSRQMLEQIGGITYLSQLEDAVPSAANISYYLSVLAEKQTLRSLLNFCIRMQDEVYESKDFDHLLSRFESDALAIRRVLSKETPSINELVNQAINEIEQMFQRRGAISGLSTGFPDLDRASDGLHPGEFIVLAAYPSVGKTSLAMNIVEHAALEVGVPVGVFSAEMSGVSLVRRALTSNARVSLRNIRDGLMSENDFPKLTNAAGKLSKSKLFIDDTPDMTISQVRARARRMVQQHGVKLIIGDYAQLFSSPNADSRTQEVDQISKGFKAMARELNIPVILLSQLNDDGKLKHARALGEDADGVWILEREEQGDGPRDGEAVRLTLKKQRNEKRGVIINLTFLTPYTRFESASKFTEEDIQ